MGLLAILLLSPASAETLLVRRGQPAPAPVLDWYLALDSLLSGADALAAAVAAKAAAPTGADAADAARRLETLAGPAETVLGKGAGTGVKALAERLRSAPEGPLSAADAALLADAGARSALRLAGSLRERALEASGPRAVPNALLSEEGAAWELPFLAVGDAGPRATPVLSALASAARAARPEQAAASPRRAWLRGGAAEVILDLSAPPGAPAVRLRAEVPGAGSLEQAAAYFLARALFECGFAVSADAGVVRAAFGAERGAAPEERAERFAAAWGAAAAARRLPALLEGYLGQTLTRRQTEERLEALARAYAAEGGLPPADDGGLAAGFASWHAKAGARQTLRARMDAELAQLGLAPFPAGAPVGQRTIDLHYNEPLAAALAGGRVRRVSGSLVLDPRWDPLERLRAAAPVPAEFRGRLGAALAWSEPAGVSSGRRVERGSWRVGPDAWLVVLFARGPDGRPARLAAEAATSAGVRRAVSVEAALARLSELGLVSPVDAPAPGPLPESALAGAALAPGRPVEAAVTFDARRAAEGLVFVTPYLAPSDRGPALKSKGLLTTAGGPAAAAFAGRAGIPAVELPRGSWEHGAGLTLELPVWGAPRGDARPVSGLRRVLLREGDRVRLDGRRGTLDILP